MTVRAPAIGALLGHYRLLEQVGKGGMGVVVRARDEQLERDVAVKVLPPGDENARKRFRREKACMRFNSSRFCCRSFRLPESVRW
jgi:serine/threonine protein kinase